VRKDLVSPDQLRIFCTDIERNICHIKWLNIGGSVRQCMASVLLYSAIVYLLIKLNGGDKEALIAFDESFLKVR